MKKLLKSKKFLAISGGCAAALILIVIVVVSAFILPAQRYQDAITLFAEQDYVKAYETLQKVPAGKENTAQLLPYYEAYALYTQKEFARAAECFEQIADYPDCLNMAKYCRGLQLATDKKYIEAYTVFSSLGNFQDSAALANEQHYRYAQELLNNSDYETAATEFLSLGDYENSAELVKECHYLQADDLLKKGKYSEAETAFLSLGDYKNSGEMAKESRYLLAGDLMKKGAYEYAAAHYKFLGEYKDSTDLCSQCLYTQATQYMQSGKYSSARTLFQELGDYNDSVEQFRECSYREVQNFLSMGDYEKAIPYLTELADYKDSVELLHSSQYTVAQNYLYAGDIDRALEYFTILGDYEDSATYAENLPQYKRGKELAAGGDFTGAAQILSELSGFLDSDALASQYAKTASDRMPYTDFQGKAAYTIFVPKSNLSFDILGSGDSYSLTSSQNTTLLNELYEIYGKNAENKNRILSDSYSCCLENTGNKNGNKRGVLIVSGYKSDYIDLTDCDISASIVGYDWMHIHRKSNTSTIKNLAMSFQVGTNEICVSSNFVNAREARILIALSVLRNNSDKVRYNNIDILYAGNAKGYSHDYCSFNIGNIGVFIIGNKTGEALEMAKYMIDHYHKGS